MSSRKAKRLRRLNESGGVRYAFNSSWMLAEQLLRIVSGVFVGIYVARYLGPEEFGILSYVLAVVAFVLGIARLGMDAILVREVAKQPAEEQQLTGTAFWMTLIAGASCYGLTVAIVSLTSETEQLKLYIYIVATSALVVPFLTIDFSFQAQVKAKYSAISKSSALLVMSLLKLALIATDADLLWFIVATVLDHAVLAMCLLFTRGRVSSTRFLRYFSPRSAKTMLASAWPMVITAIAVLIYMRIDQLMIRTMLGITEVGIYSAAVKIYEAWIVLPYILTVSLLPAIVKLKQGKPELYERRLTQLFRLVIWLSVAAASLVWLSSEPLMVFAFGEAYRQSAPVVDIVMWTAVFASIGSVSARYFNVENMERKIALRTAVGALINVALNWLLIPLYGIKGAAIATLLCTFFANYAMDWFDRDLTALLRIKHRAMFGCGIREKK